MMSNTVQGQEMMEQARNRRDELEQIVFHVLQKDIDYTVLENRRLCLLKPGAEKLCDYYGYAIQFELVQSSSSHINEQAMYMVKAILRDNMSQQIIAEGLGLASSQESRYAGKKSMDVANTILKIAKKRALVDAAITAVGGSFLFTQDMEEMQHKTNSQQRNQAGYQSQNGSQNTQRANAGNTQQGNYQKNSNRSYNHRNKGGNNGYSHADKGGDSQNNTVEATEKQIRYIEKLVSKRKISLEQVRMEMEKRFGLIDYRRLTKQQASDFIQDLQEMQPWAS